MTGFGQASRITPGYAHATWEVMVKAVESLEQPSSTLNTFAMGASDNGSMLEEAMKAG